MTPAELKQISDRVGSPRKLASLLRVGKDWVYRRISGEVPIARVDDLAVRAARGYAADAERRWQRKRPPGRMIGTAHPDARLIP